MPNWVYNSVSITGKKEDLIAFRDKASKPYISHYKGKRYQDAEGNWKYDPDVRYEEEQTGALMFWNFIEPENKEAYFADAHGEKPEGYADWSLEDKMAHDLKFASDGWYDWNVRNWGTKWDASDADLTDNTEDKAACLNYSFNTAWSIPEPVFAAMVRQHPELDFDFESEEEQGWGASFTSSDGDDVDENGVPTKSLIMTREWDIPDSHQDYVDRGNEDGCNCQSDDDQEYWYDDCPRPETDFVVVVERRYIVKAKDAEQAWELAQDKLDELEPEDLDTIRVLDENTGELLFPNNLTAE